MTTFVAILLLWNSISPDSLHGKATYYSFGKMEEVAAYRDIDLAEYVGGVALNRKGDIGRVVWIEFDRAVEGPFLVIDCAQKGHYSTRERQGRVIEVDAQTAMRNKFYGVGPVPVKVYFEDTVTCTRSPCWE